LRLDAGSRTGRLPARAEAARIG